MATRGGTAGSRARVRFAELLERAEAGANVDWEAECAREPELEPELRALHASWERAERILGGIAPSSGSTDAGALDALEEAQILGALTSADLTRLAERGQAQTARYVELEVIAEGGMGVVTRVRDRELGRDFARKTLRSSGHPAAGAPPGLRRFLQEARIAAELQHPGILPVHDVGVDSAGRPYFTMPLVRGWTLAQAIGFARDGREGWTSARILESVLKVCDAVAYAHEQGVVHRDLKPANVLVGKFGETYVMDWGLARRFRAPEIAAEEEAEPRVARPSGGAARTAHGAVLGTVNYMAPEQARGERTAVGPGSDVYSLGALLYHALAARMPFAGMDEDAALAALLHGPPAPLAELAPDAPQELVSVCEKAMARRAGERYTTPAAMAADLRAYMEGRVVSAHERGAWPEVRKWLARNRDAVAWIVGIVLVAAVVTGVLAWKEQQQRARSALLSDVQELDALREEAAGLWPAVPERAAGFERWCGRAQALLARLPALTRDLVRMRESAVGPEGGRRFAFADPEAQWEHDTLARTVEGLQRLASNGAGGSLLAEVEAGRAFARAVGGRSLDDAAEAWRGALDGIERSPRYAGLRIAPQIGLVPLGPDPDTGLWEFAHLASGAPARRAIDGRLDLRPETGVVLVLVPGGRTVLGSVRPRAPGAAASAPGGDVRREPDLLAREDEEPLVEVELAPFFLAKHELTLAQRACIEAGSPDAAGRAREDASLPAATLSWEEARAVLARGDLELPTEAQWEHAARAGGETRFWCGRESSSLVGRVNAGWNPDGRALHADAEPGPVPVPAIPEASNAWGLAHVAGNVGEWVQDAHRATLAVPRRPGDGLGLGLDALARVVRGGSYLSSPSDLRSAARRALAPGARSPEVGVRAARRLRP